MLKILMTIITGASIGLSALAGNLVPERVFRKFQGGQHYRSMIIISPVQAH